MMKIYLSLIFGLLTYTNILNAQWEKVALPGSRGGAVYSICFKDSLLFAGKQGGVYVSSDDGEHWIKVNPDLPPRENNAITSCLVSNGEKVIAAFNEPGVYVTSDNGENWIQAAIDAGFRTTPQFLAADKDWIIGINPQNNFQSTDNGISWNRISNFNTIFTAAIQDSIAIILTDNGIFRSSNFGSTWTLVYSTALSQAYQSSIVFSANKVYCGVGLYPNYSFILSSSDYGLTWNSNTTYLNCNTINSMTVSSAEFGNTFIFAGTDSGVFRSSDDGTTWLPVNNGLNSRLIFSLTFKTSGIAGNPVLYAGTGNGIYKSTDYGELWEAIRSPANWIFASAGSEVFGVSSSSSYNGRYWGNTKSNGIYYTSIIYSTDNGDSWIKSFEGLLEKNAGITSLAVNKMQNDEITLIAPAIYYSDSFSLLIGQTYSLFLLSDDKGMNWRKLNFDSTYALLELETSNSTIFTYAFNNNWPNDRGIHRSLDNGNSWDYVDSPQVFLRDITVDEERIYTGGGERYVIPGIRPPIMKHINSIILSMDNGSTWSKISSPLDSGIIINSQLFDTISTITSLYAKGKHLLVGMEALNFNQPVVNYWYANGGILFHLIQNGDKWDIADSSFKGTSVFAFESNGNDIYAATDSGVFRSTDYGSSWIDISSGMKNIFSSSLFKSDDYLFANTMNGIWKRPIFQITSVEDKKTGKEIPRYFSLEQNYPNPFNPTTNIEFRIANFGLVTLKVYDVLGNEVATLVNEEKPAGVHNIKFDGSKLSSGVYFYRLFVKDFLETKKFVLIK